MSPLKRISAFATLAFAFFTILFASVGLNWNGEDFARFSTAADPTERIVDGIKILWIATDLAICSMLGLIWSIVIYNLVDATKQRAMSAVQALSFISFVCILAACKIYTTQQAAVAASPRYHQHQDWAIGLIIFMLAGVPILIGIWLAFTQKGRPNAIPKTA